ncbi:MAG: DUF6705 family protein [Saezia sp.]
MKKIILLIVMLSCYFTITAQRRQQTWYEIKSVMAFAGTWTHTSGLDTFTVVFKKGDYHCLNVIDTVVIGGFRYVKDGVLQSDCIQDIPSMVSNDVILWAMGHYLSGFPDRPVFLRVFFNDIPYNKKTSDGRLYLLSENKIRWELRNNEGIYDAEDMPSEEFSLPTDLILTRIGTGNVEIPIVDEKIGGGIIKGDEETEGPEKP